LPEEREMTSPKCPFQAPIITGEFGCRHARQVTVRNAPQVHCAEPSALARCRAVYAQLKAIGLPALDAVDDLALTPHSTYLKVQCGGLLGLEALTDQAQVNDLDALLNATLGAAEIAGAIDWAALVPAIQGYRVRRRRG
jgi:hypothetical protein